MGSLATTVLRAAAGAPLLLDQSDTEYELATDELLASDALRIFTVTDVTPTGDDGVVNDCASQFDPCVDFHGPSTSESYNDTAAASTRSVPVVSAASARTRPSTPAARRLP
jgi:hypothetical protein